MTKQVQRRRGTSSQHTSFTGAEGEISVNTSNKTIHVHDGSTAGGFESALANLDNVGVADVSSALAGVTNIDINGGTIDGTTIGGNSAAAITGTTVTGTSFVSSGNMTFGDDDKAIFGAGSDLQIYHQTTGTAGSYIAENGTGDLRISGNNLWLNDASGDTYFRAVNGSYAKLYHAGAEKISTTSTGVDISGTITSDGLKFDSNAQYLSVKNSSGTETRAFGVNAANNLYIGGIDADIGPMLFVDNGATLATLGAAGLNVTGTITSDGLTVEATSSGSNVSVASLQNDGSGANTKVDLDFFAASTKYATISGGYGATTAELDIKVGNTPSTVATFKQGGDISFYEYTGTTPKFFWDASAESLGIGTSSPGRTLDVQSASGDADVRIYAQGTTSADDAILYLGGAGTTATNRINFGDADDADRGRIIYGHSGDYMSFTTAASEAMRIDSSGNVGINSNGSIAALDGVSGAQIGNSAAASAGLALETSNRGYLWYIGSGTSSLGLWDSTANSDRMTINSSGNVGIGTANPAYKLVVSNGGASGIEFGPAYSGTSNLVQHYSRSGGVYVDAVNDAAQHRFNTSGSEAMRIDSSGNVGIGITNPSTLLTLNAEGSNIPHYSGYTTGGTHIYSMGRNGNNGLGLSAYDTMTFRTGATTGFTGGSEAMRIDSSGNLLVGKSSGPNYNAVGVDLTQLGEGQFTTDGRDAMTLNRQSSDGSIVTFRKDGSTVGSIGSNSGAAYLTMGTKGITTDGTHNIVGCNSTGSPQPSYLNLGSATYPFTDLHLSGASKANSYIFDGNYSDPTDTTAAVYDKSGVGPTVSGYNFTVRTGGTPSEAMRIDSSGNLLVGKTDTLLASAGVAIYSDPYKGLVEVTRDSGQAMILNRKTNDGAIIDLRKNGSTVGSIGTEASRFKIASHSVALYLENQTGKKLVWGDISGTDYFYPVVDDSDNLGYPTSRFKDLYLSGGVYLGGTGSANKLDDYEEGTFIPQYGATGSVPNYTYTAQSANYVKIGKMVFVRFYINVSSVITQGSGILKIDNLPFVAQNDPHNGWGGSVGWNGKLANWGSNPYNFAVIKNTNDAFIHNLTMSTGAIDDLQASAVNAGCVMEGSFMYETT